MSGRRDTVAAGADAVADICSDAAATRLTVTGAARGVAAGKKPAALSSSADSFTAQMMRSRSSSVWAVERKQFRPSQV